MQLEEPVPYLGAISFRIWVIKASIPNLTCSDPLYCKIEVHASKGPVKYRYKAVTQDSQEDFSWIKEPFEFPLDPSPTLVRIICLQRTCASSSGKVLGEIQLDSEAIETLEHNSGKDTSNLVLKNLDTNNSEKYNIIRNATISYQLKFNIDKVKHAYYLFSKFPEEILLQIFSFVDPDTLYNISLVCRKWNSLAQDDELVFTIAKRAQRNENFLGAHKLYIFSAKKGNGASMDELGRIYQHGIGFDKDNSKAFMWYKRAAKQGNPSGMNDIGWCYEKGLGCVKNEEKAAKWYLRSAEAGNMSGENNIGWCYQKGLGTPVDYKSAVKWYRRASQHGNSSGYNNLAWCYHQGLGVDQDYKQAMKTYKMAAKLGNKFAQNTIGNLYFNGQGVEVNLEKAIKWFEKAANQGHEAAKGRLALLCEKPGQTAAEDIL